MRKERQIKFKSPFTEKLLECSVRTYNKIMLLDENDISKLKSDYSKMSFSDLLKTWHLTGKVMEFIFKYIGIKKRSHDEELELLKSRWIDKYGVDHPFKSKDVKDKIKKSWINKYGVDNPNKALEVRNKSKKTCIERYGAETPFHSKEIQNKICKSNKLKYGYENQFSRPEVKETIKDNCISTYGVEYHCMVPGVRKLSGSNSGPNRKIYSKLQDIGISFEVEFPISNYSYDFKVGDTLLEINPTYTHSSNGMCKDYGRDPLPKDYHYNKTKIARDNGYRCINIWDWDDADRILLLLKGRDTLYARKCRIADVSKEDAKDFINKYHLQGYAKDNVRVGLYHEGELVSIMTFDKPRYNKNYEYELVRYCSSKNIIGGSEKLFNYFVKNYTPKNIISYCDLSKFTGRTYKKLGFSLLRTSICKHWYNLKTKRHITDNLLRQRGFDQLFGTEYGKGTSNSELMIKEGFLYLYDCGQETYVWTAELKDRYVHPDTHMLDEEDKH